MVIIDGFHSGIDSVRLALLCELIRDALQQPRTEAEGGLRRPSRPPGRYPDARASPTAVKRSSCSTTSCSIRFSFRYLLTASTLLGVSSAIRIPFVSITWWRPDSVRREGLPETAPAQTANSCSMLGWSQRRRGRKKLADVPRARGAELAGAGRKSGLATDERTRLRELEREHRKLREEREILRRAVSAEVAFAVSAEVAFANVDPWPSPTSPASRASARTAS